MIDSTTQKPIQVLPDVSGPYIWAPQSQVPRIVEVLNDHQVPHWVREIAISVDGQPATMTIFVGKKCDASAVQAILDAAA